MKKILLIFVLSGLMCAGSIVSKKDTPLIGVWTYNSCTIKNTSVTGTAEFMSDGTLILNIMARDDYPVKNNLSGRYKYSVKGDRLVTDYKGGYGINDYFFIKGEYLYFSGNSISSVIDDTENRNFNWSYRLKRGKSDYSL